MKPDFYYLESDGQVFLVKDKETWRFPRSRREIPFPIKPISPMPIREKLVLYAYPVLAEHPAHWFHKDEVIGRPDVDPLVQQAVNRSLPRAAAKIAIVEKGRVLMVRAARGLTKGIWNLPGGFISYGEHPETGACREVQEELGLRTRILQLLGVYSDVFPRTGGYMLSFVYLGKRLSKKIVPAKGEIESYAWVPLKKAIAQSGNPFARAGLRACLKMAK
jgi:ADP-ribose pyrophosphatase YjhB (NUDIX family)